MTAETHNEFILSASQEKKVPLGSSATLSCHLSPEFSAVDMEIRWFKETDCVCLYKNKKATEGRGYEDRASLFTQELEKGNVSLQLRDCKQSDIGHYVCQVTDGDRTEELTMRVWWHPLRYFSRIFECGVVPYVNIQQWGRKWKEEEKIKMEESALLTEYNTDVKSLMKEVLKKHRTLEKTEAELQNTRLDLDRTAAELQDKSTQLEEMISLLEQQKKHLAEKGKQGVKTGSVLTKRTSQDKQEIDRPLEERTNQLQESTDPELMISVERRHSTNLEHGSVPIAELRLVLLGRTGSGKSAAVNTIFGKEERNQIDTSTVRQQSESRQGEVAGRQVTVVDTPDWFCPEHSLEEVREDVGLCFHLSAPGPHAFLLVLPVMQSAGEERGMLEKLEEIIGERCWRKTMIIFTVTDKIQEKNTEEFIRSEKQDVQILVEKCENRFHFLNIKDSGDGSQISELLEKIEEMLVENREAFYSSKIYLETESQIRELERELALATEKKKEKEEKEMNKKLESELQNSLSKTEEMIQEHEKDTRHLNDLITNLEKNIKEETNEEKKNDLEKELENTVQKVSKLENIINILKEKQEWEKRDIEDRHRNQMKKIMEKYEGESTMEAERNLMKILLPELRRNLLNSKMRMEEDISSLLREKDKELELLKQRLSEPSEVQSLNKEVCQVDELGTTQTEETTAEADEAQKE